MASPSAGPTALSGGKSPASSDDPWSQFASQWSPEVEVRINTLKAEAQNATTAAQAAQEDLAGAQAAELGWQLLALLLLGVVVAGYYYGQRRGVWSLKSLSLSEPLLPVSAAAALTDEKLKEGLPVQVQAAAPPSGGAEEVNKWHAQAKEDAGSSRTQEAYGRRAAQDLQQGQAQLRAQVAQARGGEASAQKALKEVQGWAESIVAQAQAQEAKAAQALRDLKAKTRAELAEAQEREMAVRRALQDFQARAEAEVAAAKAEERAARHAQEELREEVRRLRSRLSGERCATESSQRQRPQQPQQQQPQQQPQQHLQQQQLPPQQPQQPQQQRVARPAPGEEAAAKAPRPEDPAKAAHDQRPRAHSPPPMFQVPRSSTPAGSAKPRGRAPSPAGILPGMMPGAPPNAGPPPWGLGPPSSMAGMGGLFLPPPPIGVGMGVGLPSRTHLGADPNNQQNGMGAYGVGAQKAV